MRLVLVLILVPLFCSAQHKSVSFELHNEVGTHTLYSYCFSHDLDNIEGVTYVLEKRSGDTLYQIDEYLNGWVALNNNGRTVCHLVSEKDKEPLDRSAFFLFRDGKQVGSAFLDRLVNYELELAKAQYKLPRSGWLRNDSMYHKMATNPFYVTEDKLFMSFDKPNLVVFELNQLLQIYAGNGANHFNQNYYSIPNPPYRIEYTGNEYFPKELPKTRNGKALKTLIAKELKLSLSNSQIATKRVDVSFKLDVSGNIELKEASVFSLKENNQVQEASERLKSFLEAQILDTSSIPPKHPAWIFKQTLWFN